MVDSQHAVLSVRRQCELLGLSRSSFYCQVAFESNKVDRLLYEPRGLWPSDVVEVANVNEDVGDVFVYPRGFCLYAQVVSSETYRCLPAFQRDWIPAGDCGIAREVDED